MKKEAILLECSEEITISKTTTPEFYRLYEQSVLLALKEQNILNEAQYQCCLEMLNHQT